MNDTSANKAVAGPEADARPQHPICTPSIASKPVEDRLRHLIRRLVPSKIRRNDTSTDNSIHSIVDFGRRLGVAHELEHERRGTDRGDRVCDGRDAVGDVGRGTVHGLTCVLGQ